MITKNLEEKLKKVPPDLIPELLDYIDFLLYKRDRAASKKGMFDFTWQGGLSELSEEMNAVELQHKSLEWR